MLMSTTNGKQLAYLYPNLQTKGLAALRKEPIPDEPKAVGRYA